ncbi:leucine efflux protein LeuE [Acinetobacter sp. MD2(2019)]|uniref:leucine efflux protein LeuE n=1 Tax=Acinetobacter sp. MD2(2019) TaxID=2605273 RepID=UPI002D1F982A|nr:leucine efflux protein LeuE [Acinetobacter sp. MD2(2019)]MEB3752888.1 leucine efflux protein LeuE [Acinetobacter sp. MD2(2019)]
MLGIVHLSTFIIGTILIVLLPGPNSLYLLATASRYGIRAGYLAALGIITGDSLLILATVLGAASILHTYPVTFIALKIIGASYLSYLGIKLFLHSVETWKKHHNPPETLAIEADISELAKAQTPYRTALTISLLNPKAILFFLSFFVQFVDAKASSPALSFLCLALILQSISFSYLTLLIFGGRKLANYFSQHHRLSSVAICIVGILFIAFSLKLAFSSI